MRAYSERFGLYTPGPSTTPNIETRKFNHTTPHFLSEVLEPDDQQDEGDDDDDDGSRDQFIGSHPK